MKVQVSGGAVLALAGVAVAVGGVFFARRKIGEAASTVVEAVNPASPNNLVNKAVTAVAIKGDHNGYSYDDHLFAAIDLLNPFNDSDRYARLVWGIDKNE